MSVVIQDETECKKRCIESLIDCPTLSNLKVSLNPKAMLKEKLHFPDG